MFRGSIEKRLTSVSKDIQRVDQELDVLREQLAHFADDADDLAIRSMVSDGGGQDGMDHRQAARTVERLQREIDAKSERRHKLEVKQDGLLDELSSRNANK